MPEEDEGVDDADAGVKGDDGEGDEAVETDYEV